MIRKWSVREEVLESRNLLLEAPRLEMRGFIKKCHKEVVGSRRSLEIEKPTPGDAETRNER